MRKLLTAILIILSTNSFAQIDANGNPVFNSITVKEEVVKNYTLSSNYYTLSNNISNKNSSVFISKKPSLDEIENAAINLPSDFFIIMNGRSMSNMIMLMNYPSRKLVVYNVSNGKQTEFDCKLKGDITENRANEIVKEQYDSKAKIESGVLTFNSKKLNIISNDSIKASIIELIEKEKLNDAAGKDIKLLSKEDLRKIVVEESKEGGKLDFLTEIKGKEMEGVQIKKGVFSTLGSIALYKWGKANFELGVNTIEDALEFWAEYKGRKPNEREIGYITMGFNKELEKD